MSRSSRDKDDAERRLIELSDLLEISQTLNQSLELESILNQLLLASMGRFAIGRGLFLLGSGPNRFRVAISKGLPDAPAGTEIELHDIPGTAVDLALTDEDYPFFTSHKLGVVIPLAHAGSSLGVLALGKKLTGAGFEPADLEFLTSLASIATPAIENSRVYGELQHLNLRLDRKIHELNTLFEIGRRFVGTIDAAEVLRLFSFALMGQLMLTRYVLVLRRGSAYIVESKGITLKEPHRWQDEGFWELISSLEGPLRIDPALHGPLAELGLSAVVPIRKEAVTHGFIGFGSRFTGKAYTDDELAFGGALANQAIIALENAWLVEETIEKRRIEEELALASSIQSRLFPKSLPEIEGYELAARSTPTRQIGGDYYDAIDIDDGKTLIAIADVSGKGVPAALLMSNVQASLRALSEPGMDLRSNASKINEIIYSNTDFNKYATFFYGMLDTKAHTMVYTNAGHNPPLLVRANGEVETLDAGGLPIGLMPGSQYDHATIEIYPNDVLVLYTDGVTEAESTTNEEFGTDRLQRLSCAFASGPACDLLNAIADDVDQFAAGMPQADDITMLILKRLGERG